MVQMGNVIKIPPSILPDFITGSNEILSSDAIGKPSNYHKRFIVPNRPSKNEILHFVPTG